MKILACSTLPLMFLLATALADGATKKDAAVVTPNPPSTNIELVEGDWNSVKTIVAQSEGKVVVVDIWSTACLPCMREFPNLLKLQQKYGKKIVCVSLNVDYAGIKSRPPEYYRPRVEKFLKRQPSACRSLLCTIDAIELFDELKLNSIPAVYVYGKDGELVKRFDDKLLEDGEEDAFTYDKDINPVIAKLIAVEPAKSSP